MLSAQPAAQTGTVSGSAYLAFSRGWPHRVPLSVPSSTLDWIPLKGYWIPGYLYLGYL